MKTIIRRPAIRAALLISALVAAVTGSVVAGAVPADATVPGLTRVTVTSPSNAVNKSVTATCPFGTRVINAGGYITDGAGKVAMDDKFADPGLTFVTITALETDAYPTAWSVTAVATCASALVGLEWISTASASNPNNVKNATATCSAGKTLLGTGATVLGGAGEVFIDEITPNGGAGVAATSITVVGVEGDPVATNWSVNAIAICAFPRPGQQVISASTASNALSKGTAAFCPAGQVATGSAAEVFGNQGEVVIDDDYNSSSTATTVYGQVNDGSAVNWSINAYTFCADI